MIVDCELLQSVSVIIVLVIVTVYLIVDVAVLQVGIRVEACHQVVVGFQIEVPVRLFGFVTVIFVVGQQLADIVLHPDHPSEVPSVVVVQCAAQRSVQLLIPVVHREYAAAKVIVHLLLPDQVAFFHFLSVVHKRMQAILFQAAILFILLIVAVPLCIMECRIQVPCCRESMIQQELIVHLQVVVRLVFVKADVSVVICVHAA